MEDEDNEKLAHYLEIGVVELAGMDENGELIYAIHETAKELAPELWEAHMEYVDRELIDLYQKGYVKVDYDENLEATISLSPEGVEIAKQKGIMPVEMPEVPDN